MTTGTGAASIPTGQGEDRKQGLKQKYSNFKAQTIDVFVPSQYDADLTMDGTAQSVALASGISKLLITNRGATTEAIRVAFGTSASNAEANLTISAAAATTGIYIMSPADGGLPMVILGAPSTATHYAVANAVASDTQAVSVTQGI